MELAAAAPLADGRVPYIHEELWPVDDGRSPIKEKATIMIYKASTGTMIPYRTCSRGVFLSGRGISCGAGTSARNIRRRL